MTTPKHSLDKGRSYAEAMWTSCLGNGTGQTRAAYTVLSGLLLYCTFVSKIRQSFISSHRIGDAQILVHDTIIMLGVVIMAV